MGNAPLPQSAHSLQKRAGIGNSRLNIHSLPVQLLLTVKLIHYDLQKINDVLQSYAFEDEIQKQYNSSFDPKIIKVDLVKKVVRILLSNKCKILVTVKYRSDNGGMCPQLDTVVAKRSVLKVKII